MENKAMLGTVKIGREAALRMIAVAALTLAGCGSDGPDVVDVVLQECDAAPTSVDPITGLLFYDCISPWRAAPNQPIFTFLSDCLTAKGIEQDIRPEVVQSQPDQSGRTIILRCELIIK